MSPRRRARADATLVDRPLSATDPQVSICGSKKRPRWTVTRPSRPQLLGAEQGAAPRDRAGEGSGEVRNSGWLVPGFSRAAGTRATTRVSTRRRGVHRHSGTGALKHPAGGGGWAGVAYDRGEVFVRVLGNCPRLRIFVAPQSTLCAQAAQLRDDGRRRFRFVVPEVDVCREDPFRALNLAAQRGLQ